MRARSFAKSLSTSYGAAKRTAPPPLVQFQRNKHRSAAAVDHQKDALAARGVGAAWVVSRADAWSMNLHHQEISRLVVPGAHAVVVLDGAGRHQAGGRLRIPANISLLHLPPYSPEFNSQENVWQYLRQNQLANRVYENYDAIVQACCDAWNALMATPDQIRSVGTRDYAAVNL